MQQQENDKLCLNGCGFFGSSTSGGMCSVCYKKQLSSSQAQILTAPSTPTPAQGATAKEETTPKLPSSEENSKLKTDKVEPSAVAKIESSGGDEEEKSAEELPVQKNKKRCWSCKKKVGYTGIECRCGYVFCGSHRYADQHDCKFDFKTADRAALKKTVTGGGAFSKIEKL